MSNKLSENHHCIPQFYLNKFGTMQKNGTYSIFVFNKNEGKFFSNSVSNIAYIKKYKRIVKNGNGALKVPGNILASVSEERRWNIGKRTIRTQRR